jgi:putative OPT family oligopeptide transporter
MSDSKPFMPFVSADTRMSEFTFRALILGVIMAMIMGAANAYLGLKAGMTIAATYTTAVIGMAILKALKGSILEENFARTVGSIGGNIASGAIFTLPAFFIAGIWNPFYSFSNYVISTIILIVAGILGIMFVSITRRVLVENAELPFPESIAAAEIHKSGQGGGGGSKFLFAGMGLGALFTAFTEFKIIAMKWQSLLGLGKGGVLLRGPEMSPAFLGVGYIIGPKLAGINFSGGVLAWGLMAPVIAFFLNYADPGAVSSWGDEIAQVWKAYVRYIAIGGMLVGAFYTLYKMRKNLWEGISRSFSNIGGASKNKVLLRTDKDINIRWTMTGIGLIAVIMFFIFNHFASNIAAALVATLVMILLGFIFAAVSGYLVGIIGVSSNPTSGLTVSVLIVVAFLMLMMGMEGTAGIAAVLGVAAFTCVSVSVAGEMMQDLKAGHILGCTPWRMQVGDIFGVTAAAVIMFLVLSLLHLGDIKKTVNGKLETMEAEGIASVTYTGKNAEFSGRTFTLEEIRQLAPEQQNEVLSANAGFGGERIPAPQASLMAVVAKSIMERKTEWILILVGVFMGLGFILMQVKSPMLVSVGMYLPIETSFAIFIGGLIKGIVEYFQKKRKHDALRIEKSSNTGTLLASGLIAGEALIGILFAGLAFAEVKMPHIFQNPSYLLSILAMIVIGFVLVRIPLRLKK